MVLELLLLMLEAYLKYYPLRWSNWPTQTPNVSVVNNQINNQINQAETIQRVECICVL